MKKVLFIDRDGTILIEPPTDFQIDSLDKFQFLPGAISNLARIARELDYELVLVSNQDGLGTTQLSRGNILAGAPEYHARHSAGRRSAVRRASTSTAAFPTKTCPPASPASACSRPVPRRQIATTTWPTLTSSATGSPT